MCALCAFVLFVAVPNPSGRAKTDHEPSVLAHLIKLKKGSLPRIISAYGVVGASPAAHQTVMAPLSAVVDTVYVKRDEKVASDTPLVRLGPSPTMAAAYSQAMTAVRTANEIAQRTRTLLDQHLATHQELASAEKSAADAQASLTAMQAEGAGSPQTLRAPFAAVVTAISTSPGAIVAQGAALIDLVRLNELVLHAGVVPNQAAEIHIGEAVNVMPLGEKRGAAGQVVLRGSAVNPQTGLVAVDVALPPEGFFAGEMAVAQIVVGEAAGYIVPHAAVLVDDKGAPYVVQAVDGRARQVKVDVLVSDGTNDIIEGPLDPIAPLVLDGNYQLRNGMKLRPANPNADGT
nr:efflux RND transporter periplasmic adaptor subunit [Bradyrhizobium sp.]